MFDQRRLDRGHGTDKNILAGEHRRRARTNRFGRGEIMARLSRIGVIAMLIAIAPSLCVAADDYPNKPLRFLVPFPAGGGTDGMARILGGKLTEMWGQQVVIDNRAGAQGNIGTAAGARAAPDGYTLTLAHSGSQAINPHLYSAPGFDTLKDFAAVSNGVIMPFILVVHPSLPVKTTKELVALAKQRPGQLTFASSSSGPWIAGELFKLTTGTDMIHVPYKGGPQAVMALLSGESGIMFTVPFPTVPHVKSGKLRPLAMLGDKRIEAMPEVPTAVEAGYPALGNVTEWYGVVVPAATPQELVVKLNAAVVRALNSPDVLARIRGLGQYPAPSTTAQFAEFMRADYERWGKVVKASGARVE
jgi:tripartite-type tricarboxylate transporter receptor subunit TctC